jgi:hypothetical protein
MEKRSLRGKLENSATQIARYDKAHGFCYPELKTRIKDLLSTYTTSDQEVEQVYNNIMAEVLK